MPAPTLTPAAGRYGIGTTVRLSIPQSYWQYANARYTIDGTTPNCATSTVYSAPITMNQTGNIAVKAVTCPKNDAGRALYQESTITSVVYLIARYL